MVAFRKPGPCFIFDHKPHPGFDPSEFNPNHHYQLGPVGLTGAVDDYEYAVTGNTGVLGSMLFSETDRVPGTWYDRTDSTNKLRQNEADLGMSEYASEEFRESAKIIKQNLLSPPKVDVEIHFRTADGVENITVRGRLGIKTFSFDFNAAQASAAGSSSDSGDLGPFMDVIERILDAVVELR